MKITPIASDSMGTRSSATIAETKDCKIFIDPSAALGPYRNGKTPHALEYEKLEKDLKEIRKQAKKCDILIVSHYHYDHHNPEEPELFKGKTAYLKHPTENINKSQTQRSAFFIKQLGMLPKEIIFSDGKTIKHGKTTIKFSPAVFHGTNNKLGYVTMVSIDDGNQKFAYTSDVEGPAIDHQAEFLLQEKADVVYVDGPMTYMLGYRYSQESLDASISNLKKLMQKTKPETIILEHHLLRDRKWESRIEPLKSVAAKTGTKIMTAAEYAGKPINQLEANRAELWKKYPEMKITKNATVLEE